MADELADLVDARRPETREPTGVDAAEATVTATELKLEEPTESSHSVDQAFRVSEPPNRWISWGAVLLTVTVVAWLVIRTPRAPAPDRGPAVSASASSEDPLGRYEDGMQALRRIDRPENIDRAITVFRGLIERDSESAAAHAGLARAYWEKSRNASAGGDSIYLEQASTMAQEAVRLDGYLADARTSLGLIHYAQGRHEQAGEEFQTALELDPGQADAHYGLGKVAETLGRPEEAELRYREAHTLRPSSLYSNALGSLLSDLGRYEDAETAFLESLDAAPDNVHALRNLGGLYYSQGRIDEAAAKFQSALKIRPGASLYSNLGTIFFSRGLYSKAAAAFEDALRMDGAANRYIFWLNLGDAYRQIPGKEAEAQRTYGVGIRILDDLIEASPADVRLLSRRALARARAGDRTGALVDIAQLRQQGTAGDLYSLYRLAVAEELCGDRDRALAGLEAAIRAGLSRSEARHEPDLQALRADPRYHHMLVVIDPVP